MIEALKSDEEASSCGVEEAFKLVLNFRCSLNVLKQQTKQSVAQAQAQASAPTAPTAPTATAVPGAVSFSNAVAVQAQIAAPSAVQDVVGEIVAGEQDEQDKQDEQEPSIIASPMKRKVSALATTTSCAEASASAESKST